LEIQRTCAEGGKKIFAFPFVLGGKEHVGRGEKKKKTGGLKKRQSEKGDWASAREKKEQKKRRTEVQRTRREGLPSTPKRRPPCRNPDRKRSSGLGERR